MTQLIQSPVRFQYDTGAKLLGRQTRAYIHLVQFFGFQDHYESMFLPAMLEPFLYAKNSQKFTDWYILTAL